MHKKMKAAFLLLVLPVLFFIPSAEANATVQNFENLYMEVTVPDDTIIVPVDTPNGDELWSKIGIINPKDEKEILNQMGVQAILFDPNTNASVKLIQKRSTKSAEVFNLSLISEAEREDFLTGLFTAPDDNTTFHIEAYAQPELPFFRLELNVNSADMKAMEVIYGTVVNGYLMSYDLYQENSSQPLDETYIKALVEGTHFTEFLDKAEVEQQGRQAMTTLVIGIVALVAIIILLVFLSSRRKKQRMAARKEKSAVLSDFYREQKRKEDLNIKDPVLYTNHTVYSEEVIKNFCFYDAVFHHIKLWIATVIIYILLLALLNNSSQALLGSIAVTVVGFFFLLYQSIQVEKNTKKLAKSYAHSKSKEAIVQFYEDHYTLSGIQSSVKNPYLQVTEYREYKNYIYLYLGSDRAIYLDKNGFDKNVAEFKKFINDKIK